MAKHSFGPHHERAWIEILRQEEQHWDECTNPRLAAFEPMSDSPSIRARMRALLGEPLPLERNDFVVDRCGEKIRYIAESYALAASEFDGNQRSSGVREPETVLDVRPALDNLRSLVDLVKSTVLDWMPRVENAPEAPAPAPSDGEGNRRPPAGSPGSPYKFACKFTD